MQHVSSDEFNPPDKIFDLTAEQYFQLLHPKGVRGKATILCKQSKNRVKNYSLDRVTLMTQMPLFLDQTSFLTLNRFWGGRKGSSLAALNALYVDLDYFNSLEWRGRDASDVQTAFSAMLSVSGVPHPSIFLQTGRGLAAIWLIKETPRDALPRWQGAMRALVELSSSFGVDKSCKDSSRIFRIPGTANDKVGKVVRVSGGTGQRFSLDALADQVYKATGRPTRAVLNARKKQKKFAINAGTSMPRGLTQEQRFTLILEDLQTIRNACGDLIPEGYRNTWLHFYATCLTHLQDVANIEAEVVAMAASAMPGLPASEVAAIARQAVEKATLRIKGSSPCEGRYHYRGATIAEQLDITPEMALHLELKQVVPEREKKRRKSEVQKQRRVARGSVSRDEYLAANNASQSEPWKALGIGRSKYYELKRDGTLPDKAADLSRTGPCPLQGQSQKLGHRPRAEQNAYAPQEPSTIKTANRNRPRQTRQKVNGRNGTDSREGARIGRGQCLATWRGRNWGMGREPDDQVEKHRGWPHFHCLFREGSGKNGRPQRNSNLFPRTI